MSNLEVEPIHKWRLHCITADWTTKTGKILAEITN